MILWNIVLNVICGVKSESKSKKEITQENEGPLRKGLKWKWKIKTSNIWVLANIYLPLSNSFKPFQSPGDPHSYANPEAVNTSHIHIELEIDFNRTQLFGKVILYLVKNEINSGTIRIDAKRLKIMSIHDLDGINSPTQLHWKVTKRYFGSVFHGPIQMGHLIEISLPNTNNKRLKIEIKYATQECVLTNPAVHCDGLYWPPDQTLF